MSAVQIALRPNEFDAISRFTYKVCGINLTSGKEGLVQTRLAKRLSALELPSYKAYLDWVQQRGNEDEKSLMIDLLTTNKTDFFREQQHFDFMSSHILPSVIARGDRRLRIWSAGCSSGEEPYTIAIQLNEELPNASSWDAQILATDLSSQILARAREGVYAKTATAGLTQGHLRKHFTSVAGIPPSYRAGDHLRQMIRFARLNLMERWPMSGPFDVIFCRNVMIYFDRETQERLVRRYWELLPVGGYLFTGHSETLNSLDHPYEYVQPAIYRKV